jgi:predicted nucleic acid-binding protein
LKTLSFDTGPIISLALNSLLWILEPLKEKFNGEFIIPTAVKIELVDKPLGNRRYKLEALQVLEIINKGILTKNTELDVINLGQELLELSNEIFIAKDHPITIVHIGEIHAISLALIKKSRALVVDERTTRLLIENPLEIRNILSNKLHTPVKVKTDLLNKLKEKIGDLKVIRSLELVTIAFELGIFNHYLKNIDIKNPKETLLDSLLWGIKFSGCAMAEKEILKIKKIELVK